jgi:radical SAM protein with 4Fe4S-binding SPASM domain
LKLTGGEPTLYPGFAAFVAEVARRDIPFTLFTNGRWQKPDDIIALARNTSCVGMLVSLHGHDAATHDAFTNTPGSFAETTQNIQRAAEAGITVHTNTVLNRHNANNTNVVGEIIMLSRQLGATCAVFNRYIGRPIPHLHLPRAALLHALEVVASYQCKGYTVRYGTPMPKEAPPLTHSADHTSSPTLPLHSYANEGAPCGAGAFSCTIDPWGNLRPCNHAPSITAAGNVLREPLEVVWRSPAMATWRLALAHECHVGNSQNERYCGCRADALLNEHDMGKIG